MHRPFLLKSFLFLFVFVCILRAQTPAKPQYGAWGFDLAGADTKTKPGDDFFRYANGTWIDKTQIPPDKPAYSLRLAMTDLTEQRLHEMMETLAARGCRQSVNLGGEGRRLLSLVHGRGTHRTTWS